MSDFETIEEAGVAREESIRMQLAAYCPLVKDMCRSDCECFCYGRVWEPRGENEGSPYRLTKTCCGNAMFSGERE